MRFLFILFIATASATPSHAAQADPKQAFREANHLYGQAQFAQAVEAYRSLLTAHPYSADLYFNLGNAYFRLATPGSLGHAIASYQRAYDLNPRDADIRHNLDFALRRSGETLVPPAIPLAVFTLYHILSRMELSALQWLGFWTCLLLGSATFLWGERHEALRGWLRVGLMLWGLTACWWALRVWTSTSSPGVIVVENAQVRSGPGENFPVTFKAPEGRRITILDENGTWVEIGVLKEGLKGWLPANAVEQI